MLVWIGSSDLDLGDWSSFDRFLFLLFTSDCLGCLDTWIEYAWLCCFSLGDLLFSLSRLAVVSCFPDSCHHVASEAQHWLW